LVIKKARERIEPLAPECCVLGQPAGGVLHRPGIERAGDHPAALGAAEHAGILQSAQVFHESRQGHVRPRRKLAHRTAARLQRQQHLPPRGVGKRRERGVKWIRIMPILNHMV
jgi:hypothetical protein